MGEFGDVAGWEGAVALGVVGDAFVGGAGWWEEFLALGEPDGVGYESAVVFAEGEGDGFEYFGVGDAGEDELCLEEGEESVCGLLSPAVAGLGEVLGGRRGCGGVVRLLLR